MAAASDRGSASRPGARGSKSNPSLMRVRRYNGCPPVPRYSHWTVSSLTDPALSAAASEATSSGLSPPSSRGSRFSMLSSNRWAASSRRSLGPR